MTKATYLHRRHTSYVVACGSLVTKYSALLQGGAAVVRQTALLMQGEQLPCLSFSSTLSSRLSSSVSNTCGITRVSLWLLHGVFILWCKTLHSSTCVCKATCRVFMHSCNLQDEDVLRLVQVCWPTKEAAGTNTGRRTPTRKPPTRKSPTKSNPTVLHQGGLSTSLWVTPACSQASRADNPATLRPKPTCGNDPATIWPKPAFAKWRYAPDFLVILS